MNMKSVNSDEGRTISLEAVPSDLRWVHQLVHEPQEFTDLPRRRYGFWPDRQAVSAKRADDAAHVQQMAALDLLSDGVALGRYRATLSLEDKLNILGGERCSADAETRRPVVATARRNDATSGQALGHFARLSQQMLGSWFGAPGAPLKQAAPAYVRAR